MLLLDAKLTICGFTVVEWISIISGIGTLLSALVALWMIKEVRKQRQAIYKPNIHLPSFSSWVSGMPFDREYPHFKFQSKAYSNVINSRQSLESKEPSILLAHPLINIGLGAATEVKLEWIFDYDKACKALNNIVQPEFRAVLSRNWFNLGDHIFLYDKNDSKNQITSMNAKDLKESSVEFILPENQRSFDDPVYIPPMIAKLFCYYAAIQLAKPEIKADEFYYEKFAGMPQPKVVIRYIDAFGKSYRKLFELEIVFIGTDEEDKIGILHVQSKKTS